MLSNRKCKEEPNIVAFREFFWLFLTEIYKIVTTNVRHILKNKKYLLNILQQTATYQYKQFIK